MHELLGTPRDMALIVFRTVVVYLAVLLGFRLIGKREVGQLAPFDLALMLLIANAVQNAMVGPDSSLGGGLTAAFVLLGVNYLLGRLAVRSRKVEKMLRGRARILVNRGHVYEESLKDEGITHEDLLQALRENGCATLEECRTFLMDKANPETAKLLSLAILELRMELHHVTDSELKALCDLMVPGDQPAQDTEAGQGLRLPPYLKLIK